MKPWARGSECTKGHLMTIGATTCSSTVTSLVLVAHIHTRTICAPPHSPSGIIPVAVTVGASVLAYWGTSLATIEFCVRR